MYSTRDQGPMLSVEDFRAMPEQEGYRLELSDGNMVREPAPGSEHGFLSTRLARFLDVYAEARGDVCVLTGTGCTLSESPPTVRVPDVAVLVGVPYGQLPRGFAGPPAIAIEINSPCNSASDIQKKIGEYLSAGVRRVWIVDPPTRSVTVYRSASDIALIRDGAVQGEDVLRGFALALSDLFVAGS